MLKSPPSIISGDEKTGVLSGLRKWAMLRQNFS
jgi:hypothetical protein